MSEKGLKMHTECCICHSGENLIRAYRTEETCAGRDFNIYFSCCKACLPKLEPGYSIIDDNGLVDTGVAEAQGPAIADTLYDSSWSRKKKKAREPRKKIRQSPPGQLNLFEEEE